ncbi:hypothetical protein EB796_019610 [Bugula neritina]|uniref:Integrase catalytic domain-containing protein n=1 Tax=Bugula neritina TaxID=10212 RepID=A0A7J7J7E7_BUGNE|nr:hypothetical protein EB796_019610 [Bugula neritina]
MRYAPKIEYIPGSRNHVADALSRAPSGLPSRIDVMLVEELEASTSIIPSIDPMIEEIKEAQQLDAVCQEVQNLIIKGWPTYKTDAHTAVHPYWDVKGHLTQSKGLLLYDQRLVIPSNLRLKLLDRIHQAHQGIVKCQARARRAIWWPGMSKQIKEMVQGCRQCRINSPTPVEPLQPSTLPSKPWIKLGADLFEFQKKNYLLVVDYHSRYIEVRRLDSLSSAFTVDKVKSIFSTHGIPEVVISDNGPQFSSREFQEFAKSYGFQHLTSSPKYPKANGEAERAVGTVKRLWSKTTDPYLSLLTYRATPLENGFTPSEPLMNRLLRTTLPSMPETRVVHKPPNIAEKEQHINLRTMNNYNQRHKATLLPELSQGSPVYVRDTKKQGTVLASVAPHSYTVKTETGVIRRNRSALVDLREEDPVVLEPNAPPPVPMGAEVLSPKANKKANPSGTQAPGTLVAEGSGTSLAHTASPTVPGRFGALSRERRLPRRFDDYLMN